MPQDALAIDAQIAGILPSSQQSGSAIATYTDEKGNIYQGDVGQGDGPVMVPVTQAPVVPPVPRGGTQYIVSQVNLLL